MEELTAKVDVLTKEWHQLEEDVHVLRAEKSHLQKITSTLKGALDRICGKLSRLFSRQEQVLLKEIYHDIEEDFSKDEYWGLLI